MTQFRIYLATAAAALAGLASSGANATGNVVWVNLPTGQTSCTSFQSTSIDGDSGDLAITCKSTTPPPAGQLGTISLSGTSAGKYSGTKATTTTAANVTVYVNRQGGATGILNGTLAVTGTGCTLTSTDVTYADAVAGLKSVTLSATTAGTPACTVTLSSTTTNGLGPVTSAPVDVIDPAAPPPPIAGCPTTPANVVMGTLDTAGHALYIVDRGRTDGLGATIYSYPLGHSAPGQVQASSVPSTPNGMNVSMSISKCPGDFATAKTDPTLIFFWPWGGNPSYPCTSTGSAEASVIRWDTTLTSGNCKVTLNEQWYVNLRVTDAAANYMCPPANANGPGCTFIFSWN